MITGTKLLTAGILATISMTSGASNQTQTREIAKEAYIYAAPMIQNYETFYKQVVDTHAPEYVGGFGHIRNYSEPFTPKNHDVV